MLNTIQPSALTPHHGLRHAAIRLDARPPRVLYFAPKECWPANTGAKLRNYYLARELSRAAHVTYLGFSDKAGGVATGDCGEVLSPPFSGGGRAITVPYEGGYTPSKLIRGLLGRTPITVLNYATQAMARELARLLDEQEFDIVQVESVHLFSYLPAIRAARNRPLVVCDWHNVESELMRRYSRHAPSPARRFYAGVTARRLAHLERSAMSEFDAHIVVSERDRARLLEMAPCARVFVAENGVDSDYFSDYEIERAHARWLAGPGRSAAPQKACQGRAGSRRLLFVGSMDYSANIEAVVRFAREVWPALHRQQPHTVFTVVGRSPSAEVRALGRLPGVEVTGTVEDVRPYYREAFAAVVPLRIGGGSRLKILEAMAAGVPVVSTRLGAEGLDLYDGENIILADEAAEMSGALFELAENPALGRRVAAAARSFVRGRYDWSEIGRALLDTHLGLLDEARLIARGENLLQGIGC
jgi:glycosyltransferase involved in cell wall biosynthesis